MELHEVKKWDKILWAVILAGACAGVIPWAGQPIFLVIGILGIVVRMVLLLRYWRCPHCSETLPIHGMGKLQNCPKCGRALEPGQE